MLALTLGSFTLLWGTFVGYRKTMKVLSNDDLWKRAEESDTAPLAKVLGGTTGIAVGYLYSAGPRPLSALGLGEMAAAVFLGPVATVLAYIVQGHSPDPEVLAVSLPFALLIASMILSINIRDIQKDLRFRRTVAIVLGHSGAVHLLTGLLFSAYLAMASLLVFRIVPWTAGFALFALPLAVKLRRSLHPRALRLNGQAAMKWAALHHWAFGLLFSFGIWWTR